MSPVSHRVVDFELPVATPLVPTTSCPAHAFVVRAVARVVESVGTATNICPATSWAIAGRRLHMRNVNATQSRRIIAALVL
jgi:hypothetical protein